jgi:hypothetical protein
MKNIIFILIAVRLCAATNIFSQTISYTGGTAVSSLGSDAFLNLGRQFTVSGAGITIFDLGFWDYNNDGLDNSHDVTLFTINSGVGAQNSSVTAIAGGSTTVLSGTTETLQDGFRFASLASPIFLAPGNYAIMGYGFNANNAFGDPYGDGGGLPTGPNVSDLNFDPYEFTTATSPAYPTDGDQNNHSSVSFLYQVGAVPEPSTLALLGTGLAGALTFYRRKTV